MRRSILLFACLAALFVNSSWAIKCYLCQERKHGQRCLDPANNNVRIARNCYGVCATRRGPEGKIIRDCTSSQQKFDELTNSVPVGTCGKHNGLDMCLCGEQDLCNGLADPFPASSNDESSGGNKIIGEVSESGAMTIVKSSGFLVVAGLWAALVRLGQ